MRWSGAWFVAFIVAQGCGDPEVVGDWVIDPNATRQTCDDIPPPPLDGAVIQISSVDDGVTMTGISGWPPARCQIHNLFDVSGSTAKTRPVSCSYQTVRSGIPSYTSTLSSYSIELAIDAGSLAITGSLTMIDARGPGLTCNAILHATATRAP